MSQFNYSDYQASVERAKNAAAGNNNTSKSVKVGFFKLADNGDEALVRFNVSSVDDLSFATVHQLNDRAAHFMKVSCINDFKTHTGNCPFCKAIADGTAPASIGPARKKVYIQMMVSYKDANGGWAPAEPVIWDRPAKFASDTIATLLANYGDLKKSLFKITRNGAKGDMQTTYSINYAVPTVFKPELIAEDFSAFDNFRIEKHSYWEKSVEDMQTYLETGEMPAPQAKSDSKWPAEAEEPKPTYVGRPAQAPAPAPTPVAAPVQETKPAAKVVDKYPNFF